MSFYLIDDIEQGTEKWLEWRRGVIGASEAAIIMGDNRRKGRQQLLDEKRGLIEPFSGNDVTREGNLNEPHARAALAKKYKQKLTPTIVQDFHEPFLAASLDGINSSRDQIYEIKCGAKTYETVQISGKVPSYYVAQVQHMLMVTQMESLIFAAYRPQEPLITFEVFRKDSYIRELRRKEKDFIKELESHGHKIQYEFRGSQVGKAPGESKTLKKSIAKKAIKPEWRIEDGLLQFWDGTQYLVGKKRGFYELLGENHYWSGKEWWIPEEVDTYNLNGDESYWNGTSWD
jgi:putative phage-type endonuclease